VEHTPVGAGAAYFDAATAAPLHPVAQEALLAALDDGWADPDRLYRAARRAAQLRDAAQASVAESLEARPDEINFTSSGTAAAHWAVLGGLAGRRRAGRFLVHSAIEHSAVLHAARFVQSKSAPSAGSAGPDETGSIEVRVDRLGRLDLDAWRAAVNTPGVALASLISASHEVGTVQPVAAAAQACAEAGVPLYVGLGVTHR
jgi:cysteine desulfurase